MLQSCAEAKSDTFWRATEQSNLADRMEDCSINQSAVVWVWKPNFGNFCCGQPFERQVWLSSGPRKCLRFSYCAWLSNWLVEQSSILSAKFDSVQWPTEMFNFSYCAWLWNWLWSTLLITELLDYNKGLFFTFCQRKETIVCICEMIWAGSRVIPHGSFSFSHSMWL